VGYDESELIERKLVIIGDGACGKVASLRAKLIVDFLIVGIHSGIFSKGNYKE
jgi:hypothetical protein